MSSTRYLNRSACLTISPRKRSFAVSGKTPTAASALSTAATPRCRSQCVAISTDITSGRALCVMGAEVSSILWPRWRASPFVRRSRDCAAKTGNLRRLMISWRSMLIAMPKNTTFSRCLPAMLGAVGRHRFYLRPRLTPLFVSSWADTRRTGKLRPTGLARSVRVASGAKTESPKRRMVTREIRVRSE
jgi:hypothetical protein